MRPTTPERAKILRLPIGLLIGLLESLDGRSVLTAHGLPAEATVLRAWIAEEHGRQTLCLLLESDDFPVTAEGLPYPWITDLSITIEPATPREHAS